MSKDQNLTQHADAHLPFFVYGTLKRGEKREHCWPQHPARIEPATTHGRLYALASYPALLPGDDVVQGELWFVAAEHMDETFRILDVIEGYRRGDPGNLYVRDMTDCQTSDGSRYRAYVYYYARPIDETRRVRPNEHGVSYWTA